MELVEQLEIHHEFLLLQFDSGIRMEGGFGKAPKVGEEETARCAFQD